MKDWQINLIQLMLSVLVTGMFFTIHLIWVQISTQHDVIKSALIEALDETYEASIVE